MSDRIELTNQQRDLVERLGVHHEKTGLQPAPARVMALFMVSPKTELTFDQIRETLNLSKSATSNAINLLLNTERLDYVTQPGDRKRYFKNKISSWRDGVKVSYQKIISVADLLEEILESRPAETEDFNNNLKEIVDFMRFINAELPELYKKWEESRS